MDSRKVQIAVDKEVSVSGLLDRPRDARACLVLAHGAGAGMGHPFLAALAAGLAERHVATLRYNFPYMERKSPRPDSPKLATATVRAAVTEASRLMPKLPLFAGGKSFGGRMTSQAEASAPLGVKGLVFVGFPLHPPGKRSDERAGHLAEVAVPMLFLQGTNDAFAELDLLRPVAERLAPRATLTLFEDADHSFHVAARTGKRDADIRRELIDAAATWMLALT
ncbi:MAG: dienelactone hydrolase family protein [Rhizobiales bacterium]|nr:dienelactone hydrolase family protein [Hyphomicrobiales bacterium]